MRFKAFLLGELKLANCKINEIQYEIPTFFIVRFGSQPFIFCDQHMFEKVYSPSFLSTHRRKEQPRLEKVQIFIQIFCQLTI